MTGATGLVVLLVLAHGEKFTLKIHITLMEMQVMGY